MFNFAVINAAPNLLESFSVFKEHFAFTFDGYSVNSISEIREKKPDFLIVHNRFPEKIDSLRVMQALRNEVEYCTLPIIFLSRDLSEVASLLAVDLEFVWKAPLPFKSGSFYNTLTEVHKFLESNQSMLGLRKSVQQALDKKNFTKAQTMLPDLQKAYDNPFQIDMLRAEIKYGLEKFDEALENLDFALSRKAHSLAARSLQAATLFRTGNQKKGMEVLATTEKIAEIHLNNFIHWGDTYMDEGDTESSRGAFESALDLDPECAPAKEGLVVVNLIEGNIVKVKDSIEDSAMSLDFARICNLKGITLVASEQFEAAERLYNNAMNFVNKKESEHKLWLNLGLCMKKSNNLEKAVKYFERSLSKAPPGFVRAQEQIDHVRKLMLRRS